MKSEIRPFIVRLLGARELAEACREGLGDCGHCRGGGHTRAGQRVPTSRCQSCSGQQCRLSALASRLAKNMTPLIFRSPPSRASGSSTKPPMGPATRRGVTATGRATQDSSLTLDAQGRLLSVQGNASARATAQYPICPASSPSPAPAATGFPIF